MSATDELRRLLDERGVEYETNDGMGAYYIRQSVPSSGNLTADDYALENMLLKIDNDTRWYELFGTPERAAETLTRMDVDIFNWCDGGGSNDKACKACPYEYEAYGCYLPDGFSLLEWLRGDAE